jgi:uncharacterized protein (DUF433 family)
MLATEILPHRIADRSKKFWRIYIMARKKISKEIGRVKEETPLYGAFKRITFHPDIMAGQACIRGMRIPVSLVLNLVANGMSTKEVIKEYPDLESEDISEALQYAAWLARDEIHTAAR